MNVGDCPKVCWTALVASSETMSWMLSAKSVSVARPHSVSTRATYLRAAEIETGSLGRVTFAS